VIESARVISPYSTAIIGISGYGKIYFERLIHHIDAGDFNIIAATILNQEEEFAACQKLKSHGCRFYEDFRDMLAAHRGTLDLVLIPTGIPWHTRMTVAALEAGANVLVEKPLAMTIGEIAEIQRASERSGRFVAVGFQLMYVDVTHQIRALIDSGEIGRLHTISGLGLWPRPPAYFSRNEWSGRIQVGGVQVWDSPITNGLSHFLMLALYWSLAGANDDFASIEAELYRAQAIESYDTAAIRLTTTAGVALLFFASHSCREVLDPLLVLDCTRGRIVWTTESCTLERVDGSRLTMEVPNETAARSQLFESVVRRLSDPAEPICTPMLAALHARCVSAIHSPASIHKVPTQSIRQEPQGVNAPGQIYIAGIESALFRSFVQHRLPSELGFPWSHPATGILLET